jgi:hypothetical protein
MLQYVICLFVRHVGMGLVEVNTLFSQPSSCVDNPSFSEHVMARNRVERARDT